MQMTQQQFKQLVGKLGEDTARRVVLSTTRKDAEFHVTSRLATMKLQTAMKELKDTPTRYAWNFFKAVNHE